MNFVSWNFIPAVRRIMSGPDNHDSILDALHMNIAFNVIPLSIYVNEYDPICLSDHMYGSGSVVCRCQFIGSRA